MLERSHPPIPESAEAAVWRALADPSRRRLLDLLRQGPRTTGDLAEHFEMSRYGVMKHLEVLHTAGLISVRRRGRERWNSLNPVPIREIYHRWIRPFEEIPVDGLLRIRSLAESTHLEAKQKETIMSQATNLPTVDIQLEIAVAAPSETVWKALTSDIAGWWPGDFQVRTDGKLIVEPKVGGLIYEDWGGGDGACWGTVLIFETGKRIQWATDLTADYGGPARSFVSYILEPEGQSTVLKFRDTPFGSLSDKTLQDMEGGWRYLLEEKLKPYCEG